MSIGFDPPSDLERDLHAAGVDLDRVADDGEARRAAARTALRSSRR
jgi:hypothetical protein